jgi:hypothetical protein
MAKVLGFTGTRQGMTLAQRKAIESLLRDGLALDSVLVHGDCVGADADMHTLARDASVSYRVRGRVAFWHVGNRAPCEEEGEAFVCCVARWDSHSLWAGRNVMNLSKIFVDPDALDALETSGILRRVLTPAELIVIADYLVALIDEKKHGDVIRLWRALTIFGEGVTAYGNLNNFYNTCATSGEPVRRAFGRLYAEQGDDCSWIP